MAKDIEQKLNEGRILFITSNMSTSDISDTILKIMAWNKINEKTTINIYLSSSCQYLENYIAIYDVLMSIKNPIDVYCFGMVAGFAVIFLALNKGKRYALNHTTISLNQPIGVMNYGVNQETEIAIEAKRTTEERTLFEEILSNGINKSIDIIHQDVEKERSFTANEALEYGLIDQILE